MHPVAQRLPVHAAGPCCQKPRMPVQHHCNRQNAPRLLGIRRACRLRPQLRNTQILACNLDCRHAALRESMTRGIDSYPGQFGNPPGVRFLGGWYHIHLSYTGLPPFKDSEQAFRLFAADELLKAGIAPRIPAYLWRRWAWIPRSSTLRKATILISPACRRAMGWRADAGLQEIITQLIQRVGIRLNSFRWQELSKIWKQPWEE